MKVNNGKVICPVTGNKITRFELKYGCHVKDFAFAEQTTPAAIHMRVMKFGSPFQRRNRPTVCEILTGYSKRFLSEHIGLHYNYIAQKILTREGQQDVMRMFATSNATPVDIDGKMTRLEDIVDRWSWLMEEHEDYLTWRYNHTVMLLENKYGPL